MICHKIMWVGVRFVVHRERVCGRFRDSSRVFVVHVRPRSVHQCGCSSLRAVPVIVQCRFQNVSWKQAKTSSNQAAERGSGECENSERTHPIMRKPAKNGTSKTPSTQNRFEILSNSKHRAAPHKAKQSSTSEIDPNAPPHRGRQEDQ